MHTINLKLAAAIAFLMPAPVAYGQQALSGKYSGSYEYEIQGHGPKRGMTSRIWVELEVAGQSGNSVTGTWHILSGKCKGAYAFSGNYQDDRFHAVTGQGSTPGCGNLRLNFTLDGSTLVGTMGKREIVLTK